MLTDLNREFQELINCLTSRNVDFLVVGAHALAFHGVARFTNDLDLWIRRTEDNVRKLGLALGDFGIKVSDSEMGRLLTDRKFIRLGREPSQIDILNFVDGCEFEIAVERASHQTLGKTDVAIIGLEDYVATKLASGRPKDASDLVLLRSMIGPLPGDPKNG